MPAVLLPAADRRVHPRADATRSRRWPSYAPGDRRAGRLRGARGLPARSTARFGSAASRERRRRRRWRRSWRRVFAERSEFGFEPAHFEAAYGELERALYEGHCTATVIAPVLGVALDPDTTELALGDGLSLIRGDALAEAPAEAVWGDGEEPNVLAVLAVDQERSARPPVSVARARFRRILTALRLFERGGYALGPVGWARTEAGSWRPVAIGASGRPRLLTLVPAAQEEELRAFCELVTRRAPGRGRAGLGAGAVRDGMRAPGAVRGADRLPAGAAGAAGARGAGQRAAGPAAGRDLRAARGSGGAGRAHGPRDLAGAGGDHRAGRRPRPASTRWWRSWPSTCGRSCATRCAATWTRTCARWPTSCWPRRRALPDRRDQLG